VPSLSRQQIVEAAIEAADEEGAEAISMRRVASRLGSGTMTLYWYISNKQDLVELMVDQVLGEIELPALHLDDWRLDLKMIANNTRGVLRRHPWVAPMVSFRQPSGPNWLRHREACLASIEDAAFDSETMASVVNALNVFVLGFVRDELADDGPPTSSPVEVDPGQFPAFARQLREVGQVGHDDHNFEFGLDCLLDGIASRVPRAQRRRFLPHRP
jgi:AcrR family transcriptional regulator